MASVYGLVYSENGSPPGDAEDKSKTPKVFREGDMHVFPYAPSRTIPDSIVDSFEAVLFPLLVVVGGYLPSK